MTILAIDDEPLMLMHLKRELQKVFPQADIETFAECGDLLNYLHSAQGRSIDYAFLDIKLRGMLGLDLARRIKELTPKTRILFCTAYARYALQAYQTHALGYLVKPVTAEKLREAVLQIETQLGTPLPVANKLTVRTFGSFEVLYNGVPLNFEREKAKELLAVLIDHRGMPMTNGEIEAVLWETGTTPCYLHTVLHSLRKTLRSVGCEDILQRTRNHTNIDVNRVQCDLYDFLRGSSDAVNRYEGTYMSNYSWAEVTNARLFTGNIADFALAAEA